MSLQHKYSLDAHNANDVQLVMNSMSTALREAWRLQNQAVKPSRLPQHLWATPESALRGLNAITGWQMPLEQWLHDAQEACLSRFGPLEGWVREDVTTSRPMQWEALFGEAIAVVKQAKLDVQAQRISPDFDWEGPGRAISSLDFVLRAVPLMHEACKEGSLPEGITISKNFHPFRAVIQINVRDAQGLFLGQAEMLEPAIQMAQTVHLASRDLHELTLDEFARVTTVAKASEVPTAYGARLPDKVQKFFERAYLCRQRLDQSEWTDAQKAVGQADWVRHAALILQDRIADREKDWDVDMLRFQGVGVLLTTRLQFKDSHVLRMAHQAEVDAALRNGKHVPQRVLDSLEEGVATASAPVEPGDRPRG